MGFDSCIRMFLLLWDLLSNSCLRSSSSRTSVQFTSTSGNTFTHSAQPGHSGLLLMSVMFCCVGSSEWCKPKLHLPYIRCCHSFHVYVTQSPSNKIHYTYQLGNPLYTFMTDPPKRWLPAHSTIMHNSSNEGQKYLPNYFSNRNWIIGTIILCLCDPFILKHIQLQVQTTHRAHFDLTSRFFMKNIYQFSSSQDRILVGIS